MAHGDVEEAAADVGDVDVAGATCRVAPSSWVANGTCTPAQADWVWEELKKLEGMSTTAWPVKVSPPDPVGIGSIM